VTTAYPLTWPETMPRSKMRERGAFKTSLAGALKNVQTSLKLFAKDSGKACSGVVISSNVSLGAERPADPGVAVWFGWDGLQVCIPVDRYQTVEANLQAIHHVIEARRVELRHGTLALVRASFQGFKALPPPSGGHWSDVLGVTKMATEADIETAYRKAAKGAHPDTGGSTDAMARLNSARQSALKDRASH
jgi:DnaJ domain